MAGEWETVPLEELVVPGRGISYGIVQPGAPVDDGVPIVRVTDVRNGRIATTDPLRVASQIEASHARTRLRGGELLLTLVGTVGESAIVPESLSEWNVARAVAVIPVKHDVGAYWVQVALKSPTVRHVIDSRLNTTVQATLNLRDVAQLPIVLPPKGERERIVHILGTLDDKIELNRRMNETLEAMARALFKSWFVDFDPVRAKAEGRDPGLPQPLADLFPDSFEDSELGEIPKGWLVAELGQVAEIIDCLHAKKPDRCETGQLYLQLNNIRDDGLIDISDSFLVSDADYQKWISRTEATQGDCVITNVGRVGAVAQIPSGVKAALGRNMTSIRCKSDFPFPTFLIECLLSGAMREEIRMKMDTGTILDALNVKSIPKLRFSRSSLEIAGRFETAARPLRCRMEQNISESRTLAALRDALLPKLISGELRVRGAL